MPDIRPPSKFRIATALGQQNLAKALEDFDELGYEAAHVVFCGITERPNMISRESERFPTFTVVGVLR